MIITCFDYKHPTGSHRTSQSLAQVKLNLLSHGKPCQTKLTNFHSFDIKNVMRVWANSASGPPFCQGLACIHPPGADKAAECTYKLHPMCSTWNRAQHLSAGLSSMPHQIFSPFLKRILRDLDVFPLETALVGQRRRGMEKLTLGFSTCLHRF